MKTFLNLFALCLIVSYPMGASAQTNAPADAPAKESMQDRMLASLTPDEKAKYLAARDKAFAADPTLKTEQDSLIQQGKDLHSSGDATPEEKMAFGQKMKAYSEKMKQALLKQDSTLQPIFDKLDKARAAAKAKRAAAMGGAGQ